MSAMKECHGEDGGPAFPQENFKNGESQWSNGVGGLSIRDWFAGQAILGMARDITTIPDVDSQENFMRCLPATAYRIADAMLAEREKTT